MGFDEFFDPKTLEYIYHGETAVVVQGTLRPSDMTGDQHLLKSSPFGDGWDLAGVPQLINDEHGLLLNSNRMVGSINYGIDTSNDRWMIVFPGMHHASLPSAITASNRWSLDRQRRTLPSSAC